MQLRPPPASARAAVIADTHLPRAGRTLPPGCLRRLRSAELILHAGDIRSVEVLEQLRALGPPVLAVHGNVDDPALRAQLPETLELRLGGRRLGMIHDAGPAAGRLARLRRRFPSCEAVIFGHSHIPLLERHEGFTIFNPGSPTDRRRQAEHTMGMLSCGPAALRFRVVELGR
jgi:hypothetical protein